MGSSKRGSHLHMNSRQNYRGEVMAGQVGRHWACGKHGLQGTIRMLHDLSKNWARRQFDSGGKGRPSSVVRAQFCICLYVPEICRYTRYGAGVKTPQHVLPTVLYTPSCRCCPQSGEASLAIRVIR